MLYQSQAPAWSICCPYRFALGETLKLFIGLAFFFVISFPALIGWIQGAHKRYKASVRVHELAMFQTRNC